MLLYKKPLHENSNMYGRNNKSKSYCLKSDVVFIKKGKCYIWWYVLLSKCISTYTCTLFAFIVNLGPRKHRMDSSYQVHYLQTGKQYSNT